MEENLDPLSLYREAERCLYCYEAPCVKACATEIPIPEFIRRIATKDVKSAARLILEANVFGYSCGKVCPVEVMCEGACVLNQRGERPIAIGLLQAFAVKQAYEKNWQFFTKGKKQNKKVAVVGGGPAGLSCAHELTRLGYEVTLWEAKPYLGGLNTSGVAPYKLSLKESLEEVEKILQIGFTVKYNQKLGRDFSLSSLKNQFDAVFLALGLSEEKRAKLPGEHLLGCYHALSAIEQIRQGNTQDFESKKKALVIGGGNTAIDMARNLKRLGVPEVWIFYRRKREKMKAYSHEVEQAQKEGVLFAFERQVVEILGSKQAEGVRLEGGEVFPCDSVFFAIGQTLEQEVQKELKELIRDGKILVKVNYETSIPGVFAGGDCINGGKEVVHAVRDGKKAAHAIHNYLLKKEYEYGRSPS